MTICTDSTKLLTPAARTSAVRIAAEVIARALYTPTDYGPDRAAWVLLLAPSDVTPRRLAFCARKLCERCPVSGGSYDLALSHLADACERAAETGRTAHTATATSLRLASAALERWRAGRVTT